MKLLVGAQVMANTSGIIGILGIFVNQIGGKPSDVLGRSFFFFGPITSICVSPSFQLFKSLYTVSWRILRILTTGFSSVMSASLSDILEGKRLSIANSYLGASVGAAVIVAPILEGIILARTNMNLRPAIALSALGALHAVLFLCNAGNNMKVSQGGPVWIGNVLRNLDFSTIIHCLLCVSFMVMGTYKRRKIQV